MANSFACTFVDGLGSATVNVTADDHAVDNNIGDDPHVVTVNNVAPVVSPPAVDAPENQDATEGSAHAFAIGSFVDAGSNDGPWAVEVDWGDGTTDSTFNQATQGSLGTFSHSFADDGVYSSRSTSPTRTAPAVTQRFSVTVNNVAPTIAISGAASVNEGSLYSLTLGTVTDPGTDTVSSYLVHWGDGSSDTYASRRRQDPHLRRRPQHPGDHRRPDRRGRHLPRCRQRVQRDRQQRGPDDRHLGSRPASTRARSTA